HLPGFDVERNPLDGTYGARLGQVFHVEVADGEDGAAVYRFLNTGVEAVTRTPSRRKRPRHARSARSRGFESSSTAKLIRTRANPTSATHSPVGTNIHHEPVRSAASLLAQ